MMGKWDRWGGGGGGGWLIYIRDRVGGQAEGITLQFLFFFPCAFVFRSVTFSVPLFRWIEHDGCCLFLYFVCLWSL